MVRQRQQILKIIVSRRFERAKATETNEHEKSRKCKKQTYMQLMQQLVPKGQQRTARVGE